MRAAPAWKPPRRKSNRPDDGRTCSRYSLCAARRKPQAGRHRSFAQETGNHGKKKGESALAIKRNERRFQGTKVRHLQEFADAYIIRQQQAKEAADKCAQQYPRTAAIQNPACQPGRHTDYQAMENTSKQREPFSREGLVQVPIQVMTAKAQTNHDRDKQHQHEPAPGEQESQENGQQGGDQGAV